MYVCTDSSECILNCPIFTNTTLLKAKSEGLTCKAFRRYSTKEFLKCHNMLYHLVLLSNTLTVWGKKYVGKKSTYRCRKMVDHRDGDAGITWATSYRHRKRIAHKCLKSLFSTDVSKVLATITAKLQQEMQRIAHEIGMLEENIHLVFVGTTYEQKKAGILFPTDTSRP